MASRPPGARLNRAVARAALMMAIGAAGCARPAPRPLALGRDVCAHCHMTLADARFGGELVTTTGKVTPYDDVGCLAVGALTAEATRIHSLWVADYLEPDSVVAVDRMTFLRTDAVRTPMGYGIIAVRRGPVADSLAAALAAIPLDWPGVLRWARDSGGAR